MFDSRQEFSVGRSDGNMAPGLPLSRLDIVISTGGTISNDCCPMVSKRDSNRRIPRVYPEGRFVVGGECK
jgi:hypothetical protein